MTIWGTSERAAIGNALTRLKGTAMTITLPGRKDSMQAYTADRAPLLAPFAYFGTPSTTYGYSSLYRRPFLEDMEAAGDLVERIAQDRAPMGPQCHNPFCAEPAEFRIGGLYEGHPNGHQAYACADHKAEIAGQPHIFSGCAYATAL